MIIIRQQGRLGNQLFQYALYRSLQIKGKEVLLDCEHHVNICEENMLKLLPNVHYQCAPIFLSESMANCKRTLKNRLIRKFRLPVKRTHYREQEDDTIERLLEFENVYLDGFWQSDSFFKDIRTQLLQELMFDDNLDGYHQNILTQICKENSVSVHVRRGDYLSSKYIEKYGRSCDSEYYLKAINYIENRVKHPVFFVFSDDYEWVKNNFNFSDNLILVNSSVDVPAYVDMFLMSRCKHNIIANSSYSWWSAWLNDEKDKIVICPEMWTSDRKNDKTKCSGWVSIN